jgi:outer membrane immunogenic protein
MKKALLSSALLGFLVAAPAMAADLPVKAPVYKAPPIYNWSGFYIDAGWGYGLWAADTSSFDFPAGPVEEGLNVIQGGKGWLGTVSAGLDWQVNSSIVIGVLADYDFAHIRGSVQNQGPFSTADETEVAAWAVGARAGWLVTPDILSYVNGGWTQARFNGGALTNTQTGGPILTGGGLPASYPNATLNGWFIGGGVETILPFFGKGWSWKTEYRLASYRNVGLVESDGAGNFLDVVNFKPVVQTIRSEIAYKFNWFH